MITRVRLKNWKSHLDSDLRFSNGVNVLIGVMGSGKSSVVESISFALFGTFPGLKSRRLELDHLIMKKPEKKQHCQVELEFMIDGKSYYVKRVIDRGKGTGHAEIRRDGELLNVNARGVTDEVVRALQMDYDLFSKAVYSEQNGLDYFLRIPRGKRKDEIDRMLKVDRFEKARGESVAIKNKVRTRKEERTKLLSDLEREGIPERLRRTMAELGKLQKQLDDLDGQLSRVRKDVGALSGKVSEAERLERELNVSKVQLEGTKSGLEGVIDNIERIKKRFKGKTLEGLDAEVKERAENIIRKSEKISETEQSIEKKRSELASVNSMIKLTRDSISSLQRAGARCPVCDSDIKADKREELSKKRAEEEGLLMARAKSIAEDMAKLSDEREKLDENRREVELENKLVVSLKAEFGELNEMEKKRLEFEQSKKEAGEKVRSLESRLKGMGLDNLRKKKQDLAARESGIIASVSGIQERISDKGSILMDLKQRHLLMERYQKEAERDNRIMEELNGFEKALKITQDQLREEFLKTVNNIMADVWQELYPYGDFQDIRLAIEDDYVLQLKEPGGWVSVEGTVSGGERSMATLTLRVAFSMAFLPNLRWLMLDEPTHNLDANAIKQFASILREKMSMFAEQVFLITHEERISEGVTGSLYRMERNKDNDGPTKIISL